MELRDFRMIICGGQPGFIYPFPVVVTWEGEMEVNVVRMEIEPKEATVSVGGQQAYTARAFYSNGKDYLITHDKMTWETLDTSIATINHNGVATGQKAGTVTVRGTFEGMSDTATLHVVGGITGDFTITPNPVTYGNSFTFTPQSIQNHTGKAIHQIRWRVHNPITPSQYQEYTVSGENSRTITAGQYPAWMPDVNRNYEVYMDVQLEGEYRVAYAESKNVADSHKRLGRLRRTRGTLTV